MTNRRGKVRVSAGEFRGRVLRYPEGATSRPTMQRVKEAVFDAIGGRLAGVVFVDVFAAAGGMGIEALSRGAAFAHFIERDPEGIACIHSNLAACGVEADRFAVHTGDVEQSLKKGPLEPSPVIIYVDPPYDTNALGTVLDHFAMGSYDAVQTLLYEARTGAEPTETPGWVLAKRKQYGDAQIWFFEPETQ